MSDYRVKAAYPFDLRQTLESGQAFRWRECDDGVFEGVAMDRFLKIRQQGDELCFFDTSEKEYKEIWEDYFDLKRNYAAIIKRANEDSRLIPMTALCKGIRILKQPAFETLCSFIISQNNNIPRIKGIIERLCNNFGEPVNKGMAFPTAEKLAACNEDDLSVLRCGFRAKYIIDAAQKYISVPSFKSIKGMSYNDAKGELMKIKGVGPKVADCTLLFGFGFLEAFPIDVWMKRAMEQYFPDGLSPDLSDCAGVIQQYIFHYTRSISLKK